MSTQPTLVVYNPLSWLRTDVVRCRVPLPAAGKSIRLCDGEGREIPCQFASGAADAATPEITFIARDVPGMGYRTYSVELEPRPHAGALVITATPEMKTPARVPWKMTFYPSRWVLAASPASTTSA